MNAIFLKDLQLNVNLHKYSVINNTSLYSPNSHLFHNASTYRNFKESEENAKGGESSMDAQHQTQVHKQLLCRELSATLFGFRTSRFSAHDLID